MMWEWLKNRFRGDSVNGSAVCPWDGYSVISQRTYHAVKPYECVVCGAVISRGDEYARTAYVADKKVTEAISCRPCGEEKKPVKVGVLL